MHARPGTGSAGLLQRLGRRGCGGLQPGHACAQPGADLLNFSINQMPERAGQLRHIGFEDDLAEGFSSTTDVNGLMWESFCAKEQDQKIAEIYGVPVRSGRPPRESTSHS
jgi:hypothetical protein